MAQARATAADYLEAVADADADYGWHLLHPETQALWQGDVTGYVREASEFVIPEWRLGEYSYCDDDLCSVSLYVPGGIGEVPQALLRTGIIKPVEMASASDPPPPELTATIVVLIPESGSGPTGVFVGGG